MLERLDVVDAVIVLETARVHRELYAVLKFIAEEVVERKKRLVFVSQGIDTSKGDRYMYLPPILDLVDDLRVMAGSANIQAAHKTMHAEGLAWGAGSSRGLRTTAKPVVGHRAQRLSPLVGPGS